MIDKDQILRLVLANGIDATINHYAKVSLDDCHVGEYSHTVRASGNLLGMEYKTESQVDDVVVRHLGDYPAERLGRFFSLSVEPHIKSVLADRLRKSIVWREGAPE